jgi:hypothetical protein
MTILFKSVGGLYQGKTRNLLRKHEEMKIVDIIITKEGFEFIGKFVESKVMGKLIRRDYTGYRLEIPWSKIADVKRRKEGFFHIIRIETIENNEPFNIFPLDPQNFSGLGIGNTKINSEELLEAINKAKNQIEHPKSLFCPECGTKFKPESNFCTYCGHQLKQSMF